VEQVLNRARVLVNDAAQSLAGNLLADTTPYTLELLNSGYEQLQDELLDRDVETFTKEAVLSSMTPAQITDPGLTVNINFANYFDGVSNNASPVLPQDLILPLRLWERQTGINEIWWPMRPVNDGLPSASQVARLVYWDWRTDAIYFTGSNQTNDLRIRYAAYLPALTASGDAVKIFRSKEALAHLVAARFAFSRGSPFAEGLEAKAMNEIAKMVGRSARKRQRGQHRRLPYGGLRRRWLQ
jgi:hypothetical protein